MNPLKSLALHLERAHPSAKIELVEPKNPSAVWHLDIALGEKQVGVVWSEELGFGLSNLSSETWGEGPDEVVDSYEGAQARLAELLSTSESSSPMFSVLLSRLRALRGMTQEGLARRLGIRQATVSGIERRGDLQVTTLRRVIEALGGNLEMLAIFPEARYKLAIGPPKERRRVESVGDSHPLGSPRVHRAVLDDAFLQLRESGALERAMAIAGSISDRGSVLRFP